MVWCGVVLGWMVLGWVGLYGVVWYCVVLGCVVLVRESHRTHTACARV